MKRTLARFTFRPLLQIIEPAAKVNSGYGAAGHHQSPICFQKTCAKSHSPEQSRVTSRYPINNVKELPLHVQERMYKLDDKVGFIPNLFHALAHRPDEFKCYLEYYDANTNRKDSNLKKEDRELIGVVVSARNKCSYCVVTHSALHRLSSGNPYLADQVAVNPGTADLTPRQRAIVDFALEIASDLPVSDRQLDGLTAHGLDREDAWDIVTSVALTTLINKIASFLKVNANPEYHSMARSPHE